MQHKKPYLLFLVVFCIFFTPINIYARELPAPAEVTDHQMYPDVHDLINDEYQYFLVTSANFGWVKPGSYSSWLDTSEYKYIAYVSTQPASYTHWVNSSDYFILYGFRETDKISDGWTQIIEPTNWGYQQVVSNSDFNNIDYFLSANYDSGSDQLAITVSDSSKVDLNGYKVSWLTHFKTISHWFLKSLIVPFFNMVLSDDVFLSIILVVFSLSLCYLILILFNKLTYKKGRRKK